MVEVHAAQVIDGVVALVPTETGWNRLACQGKEATVSDLRQRLAQECDPAAIRAWRFVTRLPGAAQCRPMQPRWRRLAADDTTWQGEAVVGDDLAVLQGHFPCEPIVPGVAQIFWAATLARHVFSHLRDEFTGEVQGLKFKRAILPGVRLRVLLTFQDFQDVGSLRHVAFGYRSDCEHSHGRLLLAR